MSDLPPGPPPGHPPSDGSGEPPPGAEPDPDDDNRTVKLVLLSAGGVLAIAVVVVVIGLLLTDGDGSGPAEEVTVAAGEVFLEPASAAGPDPFTTDVDTDTPDPDAMDTPDELVAGSGDGPRSISGGTAGLYGGTLDQGRCDRDQLVRFLDANADKARAWVDALDRDPTLRWSGGDAVSTADIADYVAELTPVILVADTRVTNYGFANGQPTGRQAVLQRGTAVLVDQYGVPRTKCNCGNPLTRPEAVTTPSYSGERWSTFDADILVVVQQTSVIIDTFVLWDIDNGGTFERPSGTAGEADVPGTDRDTTSSSSAPTSTTTRTEPTEPQSQRVPANWSIGINGPYSDPSSSASGSVGLSGGFTLSGGSLSGSASGTVQFSAQCVVNGEHVADVSGSGSVQVGISGSSRGLGPSLEVTSGDPTISFSLSLTSSNLTSFNSRSVVGDGRTDYCESLAAEFSPFVSSILAGASGSASLLSGSGSVSGGAGFSASVSVSGG